VRKSERCLKRQTATFFTCFTAICLFLPLENSHTKVGFPSWKNVHTSSSFVICSVVVVIVNLAMDDQESGFKIRVIECFGYCVVRSCHLVTIRILAVFTGMTNYHIKPNRTPSGHIGPHRTVLDHIKRHHL